MKIAIVGTRGYPSFYGGFETAIRRLAPFLADHGWTVEVFRRKGDHARINGAGDPRITVTTTRGIDSTQLSTLTYGFFAAIRMFFAKPDVALIMNVANGYWLPILKVRGIRTIVNVDGVEWEREKWSWLGKLVFKTGARLTAWFADELVFDARAIGDYWRETFKRDGTFIPYGADESVPLPLKDDLSSGGYALLVARFVPENTVIEFVQAAEEITKSYDVVLVGSAPPDSEVRRAVEALVARNPRVRWLGHVSDDARLFALWQHAGVYFHGHSVGGTNPALVQAMALGVPTVARDTVFNREVLGDGAVFVPPVPSAIASAIVATIADAEIRATFGQRVLNRAREAYTWAGVNAAYASLATALVPSPVRAGGDRTPQRILVRLGARDPISDSDWVEEGIVDGVVSFAMAAPDGRRLGRRSLGLGIDALLVSLKALMLHPRATFVANNPWIAVALRLMGRTPVVIGLMASPGSGSWRILRCVLRDAATVTHSSLEAETWRASGGRAFPVRYGNTFLDYPSRSPRHEDRITVFVGGTSDRDFDLLRSVIEHVEDEGAPVVFRLAIGGTTVAKAHGLLDFSCIKILPPLTQPQFGSEMASSDVVFLPLVDRARSAGQMVAIGASQLGIPFVASDVLGMADYRDVPHCSVAGDDPPVVVAQLIAAGREGREAAEKIRGYWEADLSKRAYVKRVAKALTELGVQ